MAFTAGCASSSAGGRPAAFPGAVSPAALRPLPAPVPEAPLVVDPGELRRAALDYRGVPFRFGGDHPDSGFDCSGYVRYVFRRVQLELPRTVAEQYRLGRPVEADRVESGDLVFFSTIAPGASHVGIALGGDEFVHAPGAGGAVRVERFTSGYWRARMIGARRLL